MYRPLPLFIGLRYLRARKSNHLVSFVSLISLLGVALGVLVMIAVLSVINASTSVMRDEMLKSIPHASFRLPAEWRNAAGGPDRERIESLSNLPGLVAAAPYRLGEAWLRYRGQADFVRVRGVDPGLEEPFRAAGGDTFREGLGRLRENPDGLVAGHGLSGRLRLFPGDRLELTSLGALTAGQAEQSRAFRVTGSTDLGFYGNRDTVLVGLQASGALFAGDAAASQLRVQLRFADPLRAADGLEAVLATLPAGDHDGQTWQQSQAGLFSALQMEKRVTGLMLLMIVLIGAVNIVSTLVMVVADKRADIAILRTMGASRARILAIFVIQGAGAGVLGTAIGALAGIVIAGHMGTLTTAFDALSQWLAPSSVYMISHLRAELLWSDVMLVVSGALAISLLAAAYPAWRATRVDAVDVLRYE